MHGIVFQGREYRLVSRRNGGEYAGPCPFTGQGDDRFHIWPAENRRNGPGRMWYCRKECPTCPGIRARCGGMTGAFDSPALKEVRPLPPPDRPTLDRVLEYHNNLDKSVLNYLATRGIHADTARRFLVGKNCRRLTIPCIVQNGHNLCYGIKKRWIGQPPEPWIEVYTMEPGSQGRAIFNYDRLVSRKQWDYFLIIEGPLDCMLLDQMGIPATAPFGGGGVWDPGWAGAYRHVKLPIVVGDWDAPDENGRRQGTVNALAKLQSFGRGIMVFPPGGYKDLGEAHKNGENITAWVNDLVE